MCCHDKRRATQKQTDDETEQNTQTEGWALLGPAGPGPQCFASHTYMYIFIYIYLYRDGAGVRAHHHGAVPSHRACLTLRERVRGHTPGGRYLVCKGGTGPQGAGLMAYRPVGPAPLSLPSLPPGPLLAGSAPRPPPAPIHFREACLPAELRLNVQAGAGHEAPQRRKQERRENYVPQA